MLKTVHGGLVLASAVAVVLGLSVAACTAEHAAPGSTTSAPVEESTTTDTTTAAASTTQATEATTTAVAPAESTLVNVYWSWTVLDTPGGSPERIGASARRVAGDVPVRNALEAMFEGLSSIESSIGMTTSIPVGARVIGISVHGATATVDLSAEFAASSGSLAETMRLAQVVFTVTQFDGLERVKFHIDGVPQDPVLSHGFVVGEGLTREDFEVVRPAILIERPYPGAEVANPLTIRGESNTFEANIRYAITSGGGDGLVVTEGFATATAGTGVWGTFEVTVDLSQFRSEYQPGPGSLIMWEESSRDGSQINVVEIPIVLPEF